MPPTVFVVRPFGHKEEIDFDWVHRELIEPALSDLNITGGTVGEFLRAGNIRLDMFEELLLADIVIADISIHNANVYYELGIRHALRRRSTVLIRANRSEVPFDIRTDRYLEYDAKNPAETRKKLADTISQSLRADNADSPVFLLLPSLASIDPEQIRPVPVGFQEEVNAARDKNDLAMLAVLSDEAAESCWRMGGLKLVVKAQFELSAWPDAQRSLERLETKLADQAKDPQTNLLLATVYDRLGDSAKSNAAILRVLSGSELPKEQNAEAQALLARNAKALWIADWDREDREVNQRQTAALRSWLLAEARRVYDEAFLIDQNNYYAGLNSLALIVVTIALAELHPKVWSEPFGDDRKADDELDGLRKARDELSAAVNHSILGETFRRRGKTADVWLGISSAELRLLTDDKPEYVASGYVNVHGMLAGLGARANFPAESAARQIRLYLKLGLFIDKARRALEELHAPEEPPLPAARKKIRATLLEQQQHGRHAMVEGLAGGASGGDILFHEECEELKIPTELILACPRQYFAAESVADASGDWLQRFNHLCQEHPVQILPPGTKSLPLWLRQRPSYSIWQRCNRWILHTALSRTNAEVVLIVLWDGRRVDGPGDTEDMVKLARDRGVYTVHLLTTELAPSGGRP